MSRGRATNDDFLRGALAPYRGLEASERLRHTVTHRVPRSRLLPSRSQLVVGGAVAALAVVVAAILLVAIDGPRTTDLDTTTRPLDISDAREVVFADGLTVNFDELFDADNHDRLQALFRDHGVELVIRERPVNPGADGRVYSVSVPAGDAQELSPAVYRIEPGARIDVDVGRADPDAGAAGLTLFEVFPEIEPAVDREDPAATGEALEALGFQVHWVLIEGPGQGRDVRAAPPGTLVISVLGPNGEWTNIDPAIDTLMVEVATPNVAEQLGH